MVCRDKDVPKWNEEADIGFKAANAQQTVEIQTSKTHLDTLLLWNSCELVIFCYKELTANVDLQLTEVCRIIHRKLQDEVSVRRHVGCTFHSDCSPGCNSSRVLTTDSVVPQRRCRLSGWNIRQSDDEIVRSLALTKIKFTSIYRRPYYCIIIIQYNIYF